jgi:hypothetical protein
MLYRSPDPLPDSFERVPVFLAGGISNCPDWQQAVLRYINTDAFDVINPRREGDLAREGSDARHQIAWEFAALEQAQIVLFWFPKDSICPIALLEYGKFLERSTKEGIRVIAGYEPGYSRAFDLEEQTQLAVDWADDDDVPLDLVCGWEQWLALVTQEIGKN